MSFLGSFMGYDTFGGDLMGVNRDEGLNCVVCGRSVYHHSPAETMACERALYGGMSRESEKPASPDGAHGAISSQAIGEDRP